MTKTELLKYIKEQLTFVSLSYDKKMSLDEIRSLKAMIDKCLFEEENNKRHRLKAQLKLINNNKTV